MQFIGGVIRDVDSLGTEYMLMVETGTKVEIMNKTEKSIFLLRDEISLSDIRRMEQENAVSKEYRDKLKAKIQGYHKCNSVKVSPEEEAEELRGIMEIINVIHKHYYPKIKKIEYSYKGRIESRCY